MRTIPLTKGKMAIVDEEDFHKLSKYTWCVHWGLNTSYAVTNLRQKNGKFKQTQMHRIIMNAKNGFDVDHISGDGLDNRKENLRVCTRQENLWNQRIRKDSQTGFKGVHHDKRRNLFMARITLNGKMSFLGYYKTAKEASEIYLATAKKLFGEYSRQH